MAKKEYFLHLPKWVYILQTINNGFNKNLLRISIKLDITYSHFFKIICEFEKKKLLTRTKEGRIQVVELTEKGKRIANYICGIMEDLKVETK